jgi:urea transport system substrate-binding protein
MESIEDLLEEIGLSDSEAKLYVALLRHGQQTITFLSKKAGINRGLGYTLLHDLMEKGLVTKTTKGKVFYFAPLDPKQLVEYLEKQKKDISSKQERVQAMLGQLESITNPLTAKPKIRFYDGARGAKTVLDTILMADRKELKAFLSLEDITTFVGTEQFGSFIKKLSTNGFGLEAVCTRTKEAESVEGMQTDTKQKRQIRFASLDMAFPMTMFIFDDKIAIISSSEENFALIIESQEYADMQQRLFNMVWSSLDRTTIRIGILHSLSGTMAISERPLVDAILMAVNEINDSGGILGRRIDPIVVDGESDTEVFAQKVEELITKHDVCSIFGGWTSASRKTMKDILEKHSHLLWYPVQYEGLEESPNIIYAGAAPNQQMLPAVDWAVEHLGKKFFLVGSDYVFPRSANEIMKGRLAELGGKVVGEEYQKLSGYNFASVVQKIKEVNPDVILNTINGDGNVEFFKELREAHIDPKSTPTISFSIGEEEISNMHPETMMGDYAAWSYFQSIKSQENNVFVQDFQTKYGRHRVTGDPIETAYNCVHLFADAVRKAGTDDVDAIRSSALGLSMVAPEGEIQIDSDSQHVHRTARIGQIQEDGQFEIVWSSETPIKPDPYPKYKSKKEWGEFLEGLHKKWGGHWENE